MLCLLPLMDTFPVKKNSSVEAIECLGTSPHLALSSHSYRKKLSVSDISDIVEDFTSAKSEILYELF